MQLVLFWHVSIIYLTGGLGLYIITALEMRCQLPYRETAVYKFGVLGAEGDIGASFIFHTYLLIVVNPRTPCDNTYACNNCRGLNLSPCCRRFSYFILSSLSCLLVAAIFTQIVTCYNNLVPCLALLSLRFTASGQQHFVLGLLSPYFDLLSDKPAYLNDHGNLKISSRG